MKRHLLIDATRLLYDLQQVNEVAQGISGNLNPEAIAQHITDALVEQFNCAFSRIWILQPDPTLLRLVASSGLYTHINGSFAQVPLGAYKVGKIAQNRVPFLSNQLPDEPWVKDRQWAIENNIQGFAGYPLIAKERTLGVLAVFSHSPLAPEFLEVLQVLCLTLTIALDAAFRLQHPSVSKAEAIQLPLSDQITTKLHSTQLILMGTEQPLNELSTHCFLQAAHILNELNCNYCRLTYETTRVSLEALAPWSNAIAATVDSSPALSCQNQWTANLSALTDLDVLVTYLGGTLQIQPALAGHACQFLMNLPNRADVRSRESAILVNVQCRHDALRQAFIYLAYQADLMVSSLDLENAVLITDSDSNPAFPAIWICPYPGAIAPQWAAAVVDLHTSPAQLRDLVERVQRGETCLNDQSQQELSQREQQVMQHLAEGLRDREIAESLFISESTVKFHINNSLVKLNAKNRYQGIYQAAIRGWI